MPDYFTTAPIDWDGPWGGVVHVSSAGAMDAERGDDQ